MKRRKDLLNNNTTFSFGNFKSLGWVMGLKHNGIFDTINRDIEINVIKDLRYY